MVDASSYVKITDQFEKKLLSRWAKRTLNLQNITLYDLAELTPSYIIKLVEILLRKCLKIPEPFLSDSNENAERNYEIAFQIIQKESQSKIEFPPTDEIYNNSDLLYSIVYAIFFHFERFTNENALNARESLLIWVQNSIKGEIYQKINVTDFTRSWRNGVALCSLIHQFNPKCLKFEKLSTFDADANIRLAIYAANVLFNFDDLFSYHDFVNASEKGMVLLVSEFYNAFKNYSKMAFSVEMIAEISKNIRDYFTKRKEFKVRKSLCEKLVREKEAQMMLKLQNSAKGMVEDQSSVFDFSDSLNSLRTDVLKTETLRFDKFLSAIEINSQQYLNDIQAELKNSILISSINQLKSSCLQIENESFYKQTKEIEMLHADKKHNELSSNLIEWADKTRKKLSAESRNSDTQSIVNEINCHMSLNLEINSNRNYYRNELEKQEKYLESNHYPKLNKIRDRASLEPMFEVISKEWLKKLGDLRDIKDRIRIDNQVKELKQEYKNLFHAIKQREEEFYLTYCGESDANNLLEAKRKQYRLNYEKLTNAKLNAKTLTKMDLVEKKMRAIAPASLSFVRFDGTFINEYQEKLSEIQAKTKARALIVKEKLADLVARELYKEKICIMADAHRDMSESLLRWVKEKRIMLESISLRSSKLERVINDLITMRNCKAELEHEMDIKIRYLKKMEHRIASSDFSNEKYPQHRWRYSNGVKNDTPFRAQRERVVISFAQLAELCDAKKRTLQKRVIELEKQDELRTKFSSVVQQFKEFIEKNTGRIRSRFLSPKSRASEVKEMQKQFEEEAASISSGALTLFSDAKKKFSECLEQNAAADLSEGIIENLRGILDDFSLLVNVSENRITTEIEEFWEKDSLCKKYGEETRNSIETIQTAFNNSIITHNLNSEKTSALLMQIQKSLERVRIAEEKVMALENDLLEKEISFNPYSANKFEDVRTWASFLRSCLKPQTQLLKKILTCQKLNSLPVFETENLHRNYSKHFDSNKNAYMNQESFLCCMKDMQITFTDKELDEIFDKNGVKSKKKPDMKLLSFKKFSDFVYRFGSARNHQTVRDGFAALNNGLSYVNRNQLAQKIPLEDLNYLEKAIRSASGKSITNSNRLFYGDWVNITFPQGNKAQECELLSEPKEESKLSETPKVEII